MPRLLLSLCLVLWALPLVSQPAARLGLVWVWGHPVARLGAAGQIALIGDFWQTTAGFAVHYHFRQYGPPQNGWEWQPSIGLSLGFGPASERPVFGPDQMPRAWSLGYLWTGYFDQIQTSQFTGAFSLRGGPVFAVLENDAFSPVLPGDQFRTGALRLGYFSEKYLVEGLVGLWHGQTKAPGITRQHVPGYPGRWGFRDLSEGLYGGYSNGVAMLKVQYLLPFGQRMVVGAGVDAEQVRDFFQNRLVHDLRFVPPRLNRARNPHYPMLDKEGCPYLGEEGQKVRAPRLAWVIGLNQETVY